MGQSPLYLLRPCFLYLADHPEVYQHVIRLLHSPQAIKPNLLLGNTPCPPDVTTPREYRQSLTRYFFGWDLLLQLRLKLAIADFLLRASTSPCLPVWDQLISSCYRARRTVPSATNVNKLHAISSALSRKSCYES
jgi:hypothetical protein